MAVVPFAGLKGSDGVTTACLATGAMWPPRRGSPVVVECDPGGGDIAALYDLEVIPGVVSLAAELERGEDVAPARATELVTPHTQTLPGGLQVVVAPTSPEETRLPLERLADDLPRLGLGDLDLIVDCGRLESASMRERTATMRLIQRSGVLVAVVRPELTALQRLNVWLPVLEAHGVELLVLLSGRGRYGAGEIAKTLGVEVVGELPHDPTAARLMRGMRGPRPNRLLLFRSARAACDRIVERLCVPAAAAGGAVSLAEGVT